MVNRSHVQRKLFMMLGLMLLLAYSCARSVGLALRASHDGHEIGLRDRQVFSISLEGNPTTGYTWEAVGLAEQVLREVGEPAFTPTSDTLGAGGTQTRASRRWAGGGPP